MPSGEQDCTVPLLEGEAGGRTWSRLGVSAGFLGGLSSRPSSSRLFSLQVPVPPRIFLSMVYKLEGPSDVGVALELTTGSVGSCHIGGISALNGEGMGSAPASPCRSLSSQRQLGEEESSRVPGVWGAAVGSVGRSCLCSCWRHWGPGPDREVHLSADTSGPCWAAQRAVWVGRVLPQDSGLGLLPAMAPRGGGV